MTPSRETLEELAKWWRGVAADARWCANHRRGYPAEVKAHQDKAAIWDRCAQQLELVLAGKPFNPDV